MPPRPGTRAGERVSSQSLFFLQDNGSILYLIRQCKITPQYWLRILTPCQHALATRHRSRGTSLIMEATSCAGESQRSALQPAQSPSLLLRPAGILSGQGRAAWDDLPTRHCHADCCPFLVLGARGQSLSRYRFSDWHLSHTSRGNCTSFKGECPGPLGI